MREAVDAMVGARRGFTEAAAGCGKTQLLGLLAADDRCGRQLLLTHTHAGVAAMKRRLNRLGVPPGKFLLDTIAGWCLRYGVAYPTISGLSRGDESAPDWPTVYPGAEAVVRSALGRRVLIQSYDGLLVDEYQDCIEPQHRVIQALADVLPCRAVGDPMQSVFGFDEPCVTGDEIAEAFELQPPLVYPWRWERDECNRALAGWLVSAREELRTNGRLTVGADAPVTWIPHADEQTWAEACRNAVAPRESTVAILQWPNQCITLARRLGGRWPIVEQFDDPDMLACSEVLAESDGPGAVREVFAFVSQRTTNMRTDLGRIVDAIASGRPTNRFRTHLDHLERLLRIAESPSPEAILAFVEGAVAEREWRLYRRECVNQFQMALRESSGQGLDCLPDAAAAARTRARHRGRRTHRRTIGTPLLVKGLEFDHAVVLWDPQHFSVKGLYVAITRASRSLTIVSRSRVLVPT